MEKKAENSSQSKSRDSAVTDGSHRGRDMALVFPANGVVDTKRERKKQKWAKNAA